MRKKSLVTIIVILAVIVLAIIILTRSNPQTNKEVVICIGERAELFTQLGCHACEIQEEIFGDNYKYLTITNCFFEGKECIEKNIRGTPTWVINGEQYLGARQIDKLKELTGC